MNALFDTISATEIGQLFINYAINISPTEIKIFVALTAVLVLFLVSRWFGTSAFWALLLIYAIAFILYQVNIIGFYEKQTREKDIHMEQIAEELKDK